VATGGHISIIAHSTKDEVIRNMSDIDYLNGFANRFLWLMVRRSKILPFGGKVDEATFVSLAERVKPAVSFARILNEPLRFDAKAARVWENGVYEKLSEGKSGLLGAVTSRAEAQVVRLASIYALLDQSGEICVEHLKAALAVWRYCEDSCRFIFGDMVSNPVEEKIIEALRRHPQGLTSSQIGSDIFKVNRPAREIKRALMSLVQQGRVVSKKEGGNRGRPKEIWFLVQQADTR